ncbi:MAG: hypothetical protein IAE85_11145 [Anaerolinea sp.]|nr:hypothetical protein [Anaerolinea sp.]
MPGLPMLCLNRLRLAVSITTMLVVLGVSSACFTQPEVVVPPTVPPVPDAELVPTTAPTVTAVVPTDAETGFSALAGTWTSEEFFAPTMEIDAHGAFTLTYSYEDLSDADVAVPSLVITGSIVLEDGQFWTDSRFVTSLIPRSNLLLLDGYFDQILTRAGPDGRAEPYQPVDAISLAAIDSGKVISVSIVDSWTGLSPLAPIEAHYSLDADADGLTGMAHFSVAGYTAPITATAAISLPLGAWQEALAVLAGTPLEPGPYLPLFTHTDDYPTVALVIATADQVVRFESQSQGQDHVPWRVTVDGQEHVTYTDSPARALQVLKPYLAGHVLESLMNQAGQ